MTHRRSLTNAPVALGVLLGLEEAHTISAPSVPFEPTLTGAARIQALDDPAVVVTGVVLRTVRLAQRLSAQLYGPGDVLPTPSRDPLPFEARWQAVAAGRLAVLDRVATRQIAVSAELSAGLADRVVRQADAAALNTVVLQLPTIEERLAALLPELSVRFGTVTADGVLLPAFLSHTVLAALVGVRRPSLTTALNEAGGRDVLERLPDRRWRVDPELAGLALAGV